MSNGVSSSPSGVFHMENRTSLFNIPPLPAGGHIFKKVFAPGHHSAGQENTRRSYALNIKMGKWKAYNSLWEEGMYWQAAPSGEAAAQLPLVNTALLFLLIQLYQQSGFFHCNTFPIFSFPNKQSACFLTFIPFNVSLLFYINLTLLCLSLLSRIAFSLGCLLQFCHGSSVFPL